MDEREFRDWWAIHGSGFVPHPRADHEEHAERVARIAFREGARVANRHASKLAGVNALMKDALDRIAAGATGYADNDLELARWAAKALEDAKTIERFLG